MPQNFQDMIPRSIFAEADPSILDRKATTFTGMTGSTFNASFFANGGGGNNMNIYRNPARRFYDPEITTTAIYLPRNVRQKNRWCRWFFDHDELVGAVLELHAELPYSRAETMVDDPKIKRHTEECFERTNFFTMLPLIDLEFMKIGEVFIHNTWDNNLGMWNHIVIHNPDFIELTTSPFADTECVIELKPDDELRSLVHSTKPEEQQLKKRLPKDVVRRVLTGKNIILDSAEITHIARRSNPYDVRGTSILNRLFRCFVPGTKVRMFDGTCTVIEDVKKGDFVLSRNGEKREVIDTVKYTINDSIIKIRPEKSNQPLECAIGHKFLVRKQYCACGCNEELTYRQMKNHTVCKHGHNFKVNSSLIENCKENIIEPIYKIEEVESQNLKEGDCLLIPINNEISKCNITEDQGRLLGYFLSEGSFGNEDNGHQSYIEWTFGLHEQETWAADAIRILETEFNISPNVYAGLYDRNVCSVRVVYTPEYNTLHEFLRDNVEGNRSWNKKLTEKVLYYPKEVQKQILIGAFRGDASRNKNYTEAWHNTTSKELAEQVQWLLFRCKYYSYINFTDNKPRIIDKRYKISNVRRCYHVRITGNYAKDFIKECWNDYRVIKLQNIELYEIIKELKEKDYSFTKIAQELNDLGYRGIEGGRFFNKTVKRVLKNGGFVGKDYQFSRDRIINDDEYFYVPIKTIDKEKYQGTVHDITVDTNHWWLANDGECSSNTLMYEDKLRECQITIADNFVYPLKIFKLGDPQKGWIPDESHQKALASMLQQANFDPNFSLIYHYGLNVEYVTVAEKVMKLEKEWQEINDKKMIALGVSKEFMSGTSSYACFVEGTKVNTPDGYKNIEDITKNDIVIDKDGFTQKVLDNWDEGIPETITEIKLWGGKKLSCTPNHEWPVWAWPRTCACGCGKNIRAGITYAHGLKHKHNSVPKLKQLDCGRFTINHKYSLGVPLEYNPMQDMLAENIKAWDYLMIPRKFNEIKTDISTDKARLLGYFLAEGNFSKHPKTKEITGINLTFGVTERDTLVKDAIELCEKIGIPIIQVEERQSLLRLRSVNRNEFKEIVMWFKDNAGEYSDGKKLSEDVMAWPLYLKKELIKGAFFGDGCKIEGVIKRKQHSLHYSTNSSTLAHQIELILAQFGFPVNWTVMDNIKRNKVSKYFRKTAYRLDVYGKFASDLAKFIWGDDCKIQFADSRKFRSQKAFIDDNYVYIMVHSVKSIKNSKRVYNLTVDSAHSYLVNNIGTYNSANVGLQIQLARYKAKRDLFEVRWIHDKFLRIMAEKNEWYKRDAKEIVGQYRVKRTGAELRQRLIVPKLMWHKKLMMRDDQQFLTFLNNVYAQGKGPISAITLLMSMGLELENELHNKNKQAELQQMIGSYIQTPAQAAPGGAPPGLGAMAKLKDKLKLGKKEAAAEVSANPIENLIEENINLNDVPLEQSNDFIKHGTYNKNIISREEVLDREASAVSDLTNDIIPINNSLWLKNIKSERIPFEINILFTEYDNKLSALSKKYNGNFKKGIVENTQDLMKSLVNTYVQGKLAAYEWTNFLPIYKQYYSEGEELRDYSDIILSNEFEDWIGKLATMTMDKDKLYRHLRDLATSCFCYGQLKGFQEQGINSVKVGNSLPMDGIRYKISELLDKGGNLATLISPLGEIVLFSPCIEGFDDVEFGNNIDPHITRYRDFVTADINIKNCPIEYEPFIKRYINKFGKYLKKQYNNVVFVQDVVNLDEWGEIQKQKLSSDLSDIKSDMRQQAIAATLLQEKVKKLGKIPVFKHGNILFISNWIGMEDVSLTEKLIKHISLDNESLYKSINKTFKNANFDLTDEEINTYRIFGYVEQLSNSEGELIGWKVNDNKIKTADVDTKLIMGKMWNMSGKCANNRQKEPIQIFEENLRFYLDYPQKLNKELFEAFEAL